MSEFWVVIIIQVIAYAVTFGICIGVVKTTLTSIKNDIKGLEIGVREDVERLEKKQDKHNNFIEKFTKVEVEHDILYKCHECEHTKGSEKE